MTDNADTDIAHARARLIQTPWVRSWIGHARKADPADPDPDNRVAAWAQWAAEALTVVSNGKRTYPALTLPGRFYNPKGHTPDIEPHLEIPARRTHGADPLFPTRLAHAGRALQFPYWVYPEVIATRKAVISNAGGDITALTDTLDSRRDQLRDALTALTHYTHPHWDDIAHHIISNTDGIVDDTCGDFDPDTVAAWIPALAELHIRVEYDHTLLERSGKWAPRHLGVWQIVGNNTDGGEFRLGVLTPRLTTNSLFKDPLFNTQHESLGAALVRGLLLRRIITHRLGGSELCEHRIGDPIPEVAPPRRSRAEGYLRAIAAQPGHKLPEASTAAATVFLTAFPETDDAWTALEEWADRGFLLTINEAAFRTAHNNALRALRRAEEPDRDDINVVLPIAWDNRDTHAQVVRATWTRGRNDT